MLEYFDDELGKIKLVNVTEARANFAKLLSDDGHYYVITKNNRPQRVVISYDEFRQLRQAGPETAVVVPPPAASTKTAPTVKSQSRVKGLLSQQLGEPAPIPRATPTTRTPVPEWQPEAQTPEPDYFETADVLAEIEPEPLAEPEHLFAEDSNSALSEDEALLAELQQDCDESLTATQTLVADAQPEVQTESLAQAEPAEDSTLTAEEQEYYKKYRKLYEDRGFAAPASTEKQVRLEEQNHKDVRRIVDSLPALDLTDEAPLAVESTATTEPPSPAVTSPEAPDILHNLTESQSDLPSLQELLRELDPDGHEGGQDLPDHEIEKIVKQIRDEE